MPNIITWKRDSVANVPLHRYTARVGAVQVGSVEYDGSNGFWTWWSPLAGESWGFAETDDAAMNAFEAWLRGWLENFRPFFDQTPR